MGNVVPPRPRDPEAFLGRSGNVATVGVLPSIANLGPSQVQIPQHPSTTTATIEASNLISITSGSIDSVTGTLTIPSDGLWRPNWDARFEAGADATDFARAYVTLDGDTVDEWYQQNWSTTSILQSMRGSIDIELAAGDHDVALTYDDSNVPIGLMNSVVGFTFIAYRWPGDLPS